MLDILLKFYCFSTKHTIKQRIEAREVGFVFENKKLKNFNINIDKL
jgi:hypothetical protein